MIDTPIPPYTQTGWDSGKTFIPQGQADRESKSNEAPLPDHTGLNLSWYSCIKCLMEVVTGMIGEETVQQIKGYTGNSQVSQAVSANEGT